MQHDMLPTPLGLTFYSIDFYSGDFHMWVLCGYMYIVSVNMSAPCYKQNEIGITALLCNFFVLNNNVFMVVQIDKIPGTYV